MTRIQELMATMVIYFITVFILFVAVDRFLGHWYVETVEFFIAGALFFLIASGWGYLLTTLIFAPKKQMEDTLSALSKNIIHELNIPLATIKANSEMLKKNTQDEKSLKRLGRIDDASIRLKKLYDELVYTIDKQMHTIEAQRCNLKVLVEERVSIFEAQKRNPFEVEVASCFIEVDKIGFEQMLDNLICNAMKYSSKASPITISLLNDTLSIKDRGVGMTPTQLLRIYERYYQVDAQKEGEGIGLSLVKAYCDEQNIDIHIASEEGVGTTISLQVLIVD